MDTFTLTSKVFDSGGMIPPEFTCEGDNISPPLSVENTPDGTMSLAIIMEDPDIPTEVKEEMGIDIFDHWIAYNIPPSTTSLSAGDSTGTQGANSAGGVGYTGPCPPASYTPTKHRYIFTIYALDTTLDLMEGASKSELKSEIKKHLIDSAELIGNYEMQGE